MSTTSQVTDFSDLHTDLQNRVRTTTGITATENQAKRYINIALHDMHLGQEYRYPWAERRARLTLHAPYTTGTLSITQGDTALTGVNTLWNTNNSFAVKNMRVNGKILINGGRTPYIIQTVTNDTSATLSQRFIETTVTAGTYVYFEDEYDLASDFMRAVDARQFSDEAAIDLISRTEFRRRYITSGAPQTPKVATIVDYPPSGNTTIIRRVTFHPPPSTTMTVPYSYVTKNLAVSALGVEQENLSAATDEPIVPLRYRHAIVLHGLYNWYRDKRDDARSGEAKAEYTDLMLRIMSDVEVGAPRASFRPRVSSYKRAAQSPYSGGGGMRYDINGKFDRME